MSTSVGGIRIVDMPDLGVVTDDSSVVGEHAGSGRFSALALRNYAGGRGIISVLDQGAKGDGVTDDTAAIQTALNTFAGKAIVFVPDTGLPYMVRTLNPPSQTELIIDGTLMLRPGSAGGVLFMGNVHNVNIRGVGTVDGNAAGQNGDFGNAPSGISSIGATNLFISGLTIRNAFLWNLNITQSSHVRVDSVKILGGVNSPEFANGCDDCWITNSYVNGPSGDGGFAFYGGVTNSGAIGNVFTGADQYGCSVVSDPGQPAPCTGIIISDNVVYGNGFIGIAVLASGVGGAHTHITISNNQLYNNNTKNSALGGGSIQGCDIWLASCSYAMVSNNKLHRCGSGSHGGHGIVLSGSGYGPVTAVSITGNDISQMGQGTTTGVGIYLNSGSAHVLVSGNNIYDDQTTQTMVSAIAGSAGTTTAILGNFFGPMLGQANAVIPWVDTIMANAGADGTQWRFGNGLGTGTQVSLNTSAGHTGMVEYQTASNPRWFVGLDGATESGSSAGSNYEIVSFADDNATSTLTLSINRASGVATFRAAPIITILPTNAANDAAAAAAGVQVGQEYRNGSIKMIRAV